MATSPHASPAALAFQCLDPAAWRMGQRPNPGAGACGSTQLLGRSIGRRIRFHRGEWAAGRDIHISVVNGVCKCSQRMQTSFHDCREVRTRVHRATELLTYTDINPGVRLPWSLWMYSRLNPDCENPTLFEMPHCSEPPPSFGLGVEDVLPELLPVGGQFDM